MNPILQYSPIVFHSCCYYKTKWNFKWRNYSKCSLRVSKLFALINLKENYNISQKSQQYGLQVKGHSRSLKLVPLESSGAVSYSPSIVTMAVSVAVCEIFIVKNWCDLENRLRVRSRSLKMAPFDRSLSESCDINRVAWSVVLVEHWPLTSHVVRPRQL